MGSDWENDFLFFAVLFVTMTLRLWFLNRLKLKKKILCHMFYISHMILEAQNRALESDTRDFSLLGWFESVRWWTAPVIKP